MNSGDIKAALCSACVQEGLSPLCLCVCVCMSVCVPDTVDESLDVLCVCVLSTSCGL